MSNVTPLLHTQYRVDGINHVQANVNGQELRSILINMLKDSDFRKDEGVKHLYEVVFPGRVLDSDMTEVLDNAQPSNEALTRVANDIIAQLVQAPVVNLSSQNALCTKFFTNWWVSKTPAAGVVCLLENAVNAKKKEDQDKLDAAFTQLLVGAPLPLAPSLDAIPKSRIDNWINAHLPKIRQ